MIAMCLVAVVAVFALSLGQDSSIAYAAIVGIAGLGGYQLKREADLKA